MSTVKQRVQVLEQKLPQGINQKTELLEFKLSSDGNLQGVAPRIPPRSPEVIQRAQEIVSEECIAKQDDQSKPTSRLGKELLQEAQKSYHDALKKLAQIGKILFQEVQPGSNSPLEKLAQAKKKFFQRKEWQTNSEVTLNDLLKQRRSVSNLLSRFRTNGELSSKGVNNLLEIVYNTLSCKLYHPDIKCILNIRNVRKMYDDNSPEFKEVRRVMEEAIYSLNDKLIEKLLILRDDLSGLLKAIQRDGKVDKGDLYRLQKMTESHRIVFLDKDRKDAKLLFNSLKSGESYDKNSYHYRFRRAEEIIGHALHNIECARTQIESPTKNSLIASGQSKDIPSERMDAINSIQKCSQQIAMLKA